MISVCYNPSIFCKWSLLVLAKASEEKCFRFVGDPLEMVNAQLARSLHPSTFVLDNIPSRNKRHYDVGLGLDCYSIELQKVGLGYFLIVSTKGFSSLRGIQ